tara:strand:- start:64 stop:504 length:441 start_codon:yes stop_codon:yes gene_type:complete
MAVPTGTGTETLHSHWFVDVDSQQTLIFGAQHHIYTVTNIIICCSALNASTDYAYINFKGHDGHGGGSGSVSRLLRVNIPVGDTFAWNERFSFNGYEPTGTNPLSASEQIAIAAQGGSVAQELRFDCTHVSDSFHIMVSYIDQDWS